MQSYLESTDITEKGIGKKLYKLNASKSGGPVGHHPRVLMSIHDEIVLILRMISENIVGLVGSKRHSFFKKKKKKKKDQKSKVTNCRPISLISTICNLLEALERDAVVDHVYRNDLFSPELHGFLR